MGNCLVTKLKGSIATNKHMRMLQNIDIEIIDNPGQDNRGNYIEALSPSAAVNNWSIEIISGEGYADAALTQQITTGIPHISADRAACRIYTPKNMPTVARLKNYNNITVISQGSGCVFKTYLNDFFYYGPLDAFFKYYFILIIFMYK